MTWIKTLSYEESEGPLKSLYERVQSSDGQIDQILMAHSLRPHSLTGHMTLYKNVLHHHANTLPKWYLETIGVFVSQLNECEYCVQHHFHGLKRLLDDDERASAIWQAIQSGKLEDALDAKQVAGLNYARLLTLEPAKVTSSSVALLREAGFDDGETLEVNQVTAYFCYANRTVLGLGVSIAGEVLGLSPNDDGSEHNWGHQS